MQSIKQVVENMNGGSIEHQEAILRAYAESIVDHCREVVDVMIVTKSDTEDTTEIVTWYEADENTTIHVAREHMYNRVMGEILDK